MKQPLLFGLSGREALLERLGYPLPMLDQVADWERFRCDLQKIRNQARESNAGSNPSDAVLMFKVLVLQDLDNRVLCHQFRRTQDLQERFFCEIRQGPQAAPARDPVRELVVAMRKKNLSVYDIQRDLATQGHTISINSLSVLLGEEGFARLPRRRNEERPPSLKPEPAEVADVRQLELTPRNFRTRVAGLFLFVPLMQRLDLAALARQAQLPGSKMVPAERPLRALLALRLIGKERKSHVMNLVSDEGLALFAGLNVMPKRTFLAAYSSSIGEQVHPKVHGDLV